MMTHARMSAMHPPLPPLPQSLVALNLDGGICPVGTEESAEVDSGEQQEDCLQPPPPGPLMYAAHTA